MPRHSHFGALDAMRGLAAGIVVLYHLGHWLGIPWLAVNGRLAVDFFFCLSGFVISLAYGKSEARELTFAAFARIRMIRLVPMIWLGCLLSAAYLTSRVTLRGETNLYGSLNLAFVLNMLSLPFFGAPTEVGGPQVFPLNGPQYSLLLEILVNLIWFPFRERSSIVTATVTSMFCFSIIGMVGLGGDTTETFLSGLPRVAASFSAGVLIYHLRNRHPTLFVGQAGLACFIVASLIFVGILFIPSVLTRSGEIVTVMFIAPSIVFFGSGVAVPSSAAGSCFVLGEISYPVYALQYPLFCWINGAVKSAKLSGFIVESAFFGFAVIFGSWAALYLIDRPIRRFLTSLSYRKPRLAPGGLLPVKIRP